MIYLTLAEVLHIAERTLGREFDVRDYGLLEAAAARPQATVFGEDAYPALDEKAAALPARFSLPPPARPEPPESPRHVLMLSNQNLRSKPCDADSRYTTDQRHHGSATTAAPRQQREVRCDAVR